MIDSDVRFGCVGCGACCTGRYIPLTLDEAELWLKRGHDVGILLEAFDRHSWASSEDAYQHSFHRSAEVTSGDSKVRVIAIFAGKAIPKCPNLAENGLCQVYEVRPLVCRIYPMEINPFIKMIPENKDCPPVAWEEGEVLVSDRVLEPVMSRNIASSRAADRSDAYAKVAICEALGITVAAWKADGFAIHAPAKETLLDAIASVRALGKAAPDSNWTVKTENSILKEKLTLSNVSVGDAVQSFEFHSLA